MNKSDLFSFVRVQKPTSSLFDLSNSHKTSFDLGELVPTLVREVLPGDKLQISGEHHIKFAPMTFPVMQKYYVTQFYFFVPNRILYDAWDEWIFDQDQSAHPYVALNQDNTPLGSIGNYMGLPFDHSWSANINPFPVKAYYMIYDEWFRDQRIISEKDTVTLVAGANTGMAAKFQAGPLKRAWMHDYFTSCLPYPQEGSAEVEIPLQGVIDVEAKAYGSITTQPHLRKIADGSIPAASSGLVHKATTGNLGDDTTTELYLDPGNSLFVDMQNEDMSIRTFRRALKLQEWYELLARVGKRPVEALLGFFGVSPQDHRYHRPELIGSYGQPVTISEVLSTNASDTTAWGDVPIGQMAGHGVSIGGGQFFKFDVPEHGWLIGITNVQPTTGYYQGIHRHWTKSDPIDDYAWPQFANIGEQAVLNQEVYAGHSSPTGTFGYIPRYAEYKYANDLVTGDFASSLEDWHHARKFASEPDLNEAFIQCDPGKRIFSVTDGEYDHIYAHIINSVKVIRKLPKFGNPKL